MQTTMKTYGSLHWTALLLACPASQLEAGRAGSSGSVLQGEQEERIANSRLDRLAAELRALGIQF
jgi:hypothetical protein